MNGQWIAPVGSAVAKNYYFRVRRAFSLATVLGKQQLHIAAESYYALWLNGHFIGRGPARGTRKVNFYDTYEVAEWLKEGENTVAVLVQCMNISNFTTAPCRPGVIVELENIISSDDDWEVLPAADWRQEVELFCQQVGFMEYRFLNMEPVGWLHGTDRTEWLVPEIIGPAEALDGKQLLPRPIPLLRSEYSLPATVVSAALLTDMAGSGDLTPAELFAEQKRSSDGTLHGKLQPLVCAGAHQVVIEPPQHDFSIVFEFADEIVGFFELELSAPEGAIIDVAYDEELTGGHINPVLHQYRFVDRYVTRNGRQVIGNTLHERGFRYLEFIFRNVRAPLTLHCLRAENRRYPYPAGSSFFCSDQRLNRIWDICTETVKACTTDTFIDCPWRERVFWVNDLMVENIVSLQAFGDPRINAHALRLAFSNIRDDGWLPAVCPSNGNDKQVLLPTNLFVILMLKDYYLYSGDLELVKELLPEVRNIIGKFKKLLSDKLLLEPPKKFWNFFDWSFELHEIRLNGYRTSLLNWLFCWSLNVCAELLESTEQQTAAADDYRQLAEQVAVATDRFFWVDEEKRYADWLQEDGTPSAESSRLAHSFALLSGVLPPERGDAVTAALSSSEYREPELYLYHFVFAAMKQQHEYEEALAAVNCYWGKIADFGSPTLWEAAVHQEGRKAFWGVGSLCHAFGATPIDWLQTVILGIVPLKPGFEEFAVHPAPGQLTSAQGQVLTPHGTIMLAWQRTEESLRLKLTVPYGIRAWCDGCCYEDGEHCFELSYGSQPQTIHGTFNLLVDDDQLINRPAYKELAI